MRVATAGSAGALPKGGSMMELKETCICEGKHEQHICFLHSKGFVQEVERLTDNPTVTCSICQVNANSPDNVCSPATLGSGFRYSDMQGSKKIICDSIETQLEKK